MKLLKFSALLGSIFLSAHNFMFYYSNKPSNILQEVLSKNTSFVVTENMPQLSLVLAISSLVVFIGLALALKMKRVKTQFFFTSLVILLGILTISVSQLKTSFKIEDIQISDELLK